MMALLAFLAPACAVIGLHQLLLARQSGRRLARSLSWAASVGREAVPQPSLLGRWGERFDTSARGRRWQAMLDEMGAGLRASEYLAAILFLFAVVFFLGLTAAGLAPALALIVAGLTARFVPRMVLRLRRQRYLQAFSGQLVDVNTLLSNGLRAGLSIRQAFDLVAREMPPPAGLVFADVSRQMALGASLEEVVRTMARRVPDPDLEVMLNAVLVQHELGGNLARALSTLAETLRERAALGQDIRSLTSEARTSAFIMPLLPVSILLIMKVSMPKLVGPLFSTVPGYIVLGLFAGMQVVAFLIINRLANVRV